MGNFTAVIQWTSEDDLKNESSRLAKLLPDNFEVKSIKVNKKKIGNSIIAVLNPEDVFPYLKPQEYYKEYVINGKTYSVRLNMKRLELFKNNPKCVGCGLQGTHFALETLGSFDRPHLHFYGIYNGEMIQMTRDHILAKANGGSDKPSNFQTLCSICNNLKADFNLTQKDICYLRKVYDDNKKLKKKKLAALIAQTREDLRIPLSELSKSSKQTKQMLDLKSIEMQNIFHLKAKSPVILNTNVKIHNIDGQLMALINAKHPNENCLAIASIKKGTLLKPSGLHGKNLVVELQPDFKFLVSHKITELQT